MKNLLRNGLFILLAIATVYILYLRECKKSVSHPAKDEVIVKKATWDSVLAVTKMPPIIKTDTFYIKGKTVYVNNPLPVPVPEKEDSTISDIADSLVNKEIAVWIDLRLRGTLLDRNWHYIPITTKIIQETTIYVPKIINNPVPVSQRGLYLYGTAGGNMDSFVYGGGLDYITKKDTELGYMYQRFGNENFHSVKLGVKIFKK